MKKTNLTRTLFAPALLAAAIAPLAFTANAGQGGPHGQPQPDGFHAEQREALFDRAGIDAETRDELAEAEQEHREAMRELRHDYREQIDEILDDEQRAALDEARQEIHQEHRAERRDAIEARIDAVVDGWDLDGETRQSLDELRHAFMEDAQALKAQSFDSRDERRQAWKAMRDQHHDALAELLSEEQIGELEQAMRPPHDGHGHRGERGHHGKPGPHGGPDQAEHAAE
ncbi:hypothetical protein FIU88_03320 [Halomonas sp. THAF12]|uniref:periplasmic heavy metal sensor n=1 Tax=Halomonas sp. THAF12 TaxID=2587849 RepID=UPI0012AA1D59|nr:periplasmic heavy metal sensor [Halomonas sp. THAF12]QFT83999.1 hypothetical protein FIU88_03320 [Halomonas sp. THAF12]